MPLSHLQNSSLSTKSPGPRCCTRCTWYGYMPSACSVLHTLVRGTRRRLAILRVLTRGLLCTIWTVPSFFIDITLGCNANAGKCTGISQCLVNSSKRSSGWYSTVRKTLLIFGYGMNWITVTKTVHINHICILCKWKCKWHRERNRRTEIRIRTGLTGTVHCRFYRPCLYETIALLFGTSGAGTVIVM